MEVLEDCRDVMVNCLGRENFPSFLMVYWSSRYVFVSQFELF
ncbi:hypothetical protein NTGM5_320007 [Candidatus Nitrotoga sp. M5]|nr:hypothetical protein NTGM5_320007 [Candidatus Nitrotoga sp. M5]